MIDIFNALSANTDVTYGVNKVVTPFMYVGIKLADLQIWGKMPDERICWQLNLRGRSMS